MVIRVTVNAVLLHAEALLLQRLDGRIHPCQRFLCALAVNAAGKGNGELCILDDIFVTLIEALAHPVNPGIQRAIGIRPIHINNGASTHNRDGFLAPAALFALVAQPHPAVSLPFFNPIAAVGGNLGDASDVGGDPHLAAPAPEQIVIHPEEDAPGGALLGSEGILRHVLAGEREGNLLGIQPDVAAIGDSAVFCQGFVNPVNGKEISVGLEAEGVGSMMDVAAAIRPCGAEADFLLADFGFALWEQEFPVLIQLVILCPGGEQIGILFNLPIGHFKFPIVISNAAVIAVAHQLLNGADVSGGAFL